VSEILHEQLKNDCVLVGRFQLSLLLLMNDKNYPWFILVPQRAEISEIYQLSESDQRMLIAESSFLAQRLQAEFKADKMNIAAIGNVVPQLHVHHIVRFRRDPAWPSPVWGKLPAQAYSAQEQQAMCQRVRDILSTNSDFQAI